MQPILNGIMILVR